MMILQENTKYCLDTNFIIDLLNGMKNAILVYEEIKNAPITITAIASVALFEILRGEEQNQNKIRAFNELRQKLEVLPFGEREAEEASEIEKKVNQKGLPKLDIDDLLIGATAKTNEAILVSNDSDYKKIDGLQLRNY